MAEKLLQFCLHPSQKKFLDRQDASGLSGYPGAQPAGRAVPFAISMPTQTASSTPEPGKRYVPPANDMSWLHNMNTLECGSCGHEWIQPATVGLCPACRSENTRVTLQRVNELKRV